ncbi:Retrovirus-related Pol polyprotein from transposon RE1 [Sesamum angolense]|uniref:Retrovirus-related Pol polyprotein from transposon RE1 n=1 Tax=Sesamum angolense TaxID=2727404 RepID=A0AAE1W0V1_9LAMI|nr:Retrovirus-related Pol polyprotein from transposon RE1 [Sesamum angolense]
MKLGFINGKIARPDEADEEFEQWKGQMVWLKKLWDELGCLFLMGLDESFEGIRNQVLIMEPLPSVPKAYAIVLQVERQREEPKNYIQASQHKDWRATMDNELDALKKNNTWTVTPLPPNERAIGCRWIFKLKLNADGLVNTHKASLLAKGYNQVEGIDYIDSFSPIAKAVTVRVLLVVATSFHWHLCHVDVNNAFLHGNLEEKIYMIPLEGYSVLAGHVCKLSRSLYGLKQASRLWNAKFTTRVQDFCFTQSKHDHCLFYKSSTIEPKRGEQSGNEEGYGINHPPLFHTMDTLHPSTHPFTPHQRRYEAHPAKPAKQTI